MSKPEFKPLRGYSTLEPPSHAWTADHLTPHLETRNQKKSPMLKAASPLPGMQWTTSGSTKWTCGSKDKNLHTRWTGSPNWTTTSLASTLSTATIYDVNTRQVKFADAKMNTICATKQVTILAMTSSIVTMKFNREMHADKTYVATIHCPVSPTLTEYLHWSASMKITTARSS